jgi:amidase
MGTKSAMRQSYQETVNKYRIVTASKIPQSLRLHPSYLESLLSTSQSVIDVPKQCGLLTEQEIDITENYDAVALIEKIATQQFSSVAVTTAFCKRAAIAQQLVGRFWMIDAKVC